jgi:hypothetical protein
MTNNKMIMEYATDFDCGVIYSLMSQSGFRLTSLSAG